MDATRIRLRRTVAMHLALAVVSVVSTAGAQGGASDTQPTDAPQPPAAQSPLPPPADPPDNNGDDDSDETTPSPEDEPQADPTPPGDAPTTPPPSPDDTPAEPAPAPIAPPDSAPLPSEPVTPYPAGEGATNEESPEPMSEGRAIVVAWNTGFQWGLSPGVVFSGGNAGFALGVRLGYGFDTGSAILVPGVRLTGYFIDPNVYSGVPVLKLVYPIDRFAPFIEGGAGIGYVGADTKASIAAKTGAALYGGGGFMVHFTRSFGLGAEANYQVITGTSFKGFGVGPILALAF